MIRTELLKGLGGFSEEFMDYGMDSDLTTKVLLSGYKVVYTKRIAIDHYRDHETNSWINAEKRKERMKVAIELYKRRYEKIIFSQTGRNYDKYSQLYSKKIRLVTSLYHWADRIGVSLEKRFGYNVRDWRNIFAGRFISKWDLIKNRQKPYYLVQHIPKRNRSCVITF